MNIKKILPLILVLVVLIANINTAFAAPVSDRPWDEYVSGGNLRDRAVTSCEAAILVDANSGRILFEKRSTRKMYPASITKIMTAILAIEHSNMTDIVTIDNTMAEYITSLDGAANCGFQKNESIFMEDLLYGLMLESGADASIAIAVHVGGTYEEFVKMMNDKAKELGMTRTVYKNPHGMYQSGHVTCAEDMARLAEYANKFPAFAKIVATGKYTPTDTDKNDYSEKGIVWYNSNKLVKDDRRYGYDYATGMKTGFTTPSGHTLVSSAEKDNLSLIGVVLKDTTNGKWVNSITMFEYGFRYYDTIDLAAEFSEKEITVDVENAASTTSGSQLILQLAPKEKVYLTEKLDLANEVRDNMDKYFSVDIQYYDGALVAPVKKGAEVGVITFTYVHDHFYSDYLEAPEGESNGIKTIKYEALLIAANDVDAKPTVTAKPTEKPDVTKDPTETDITDVPEKNTSKIFLYVGIALLAIILISVLTSYIMRRYRYQQYYVTNKRKKVKPEKNDNDKDKDDGTIKFN